jgi:signal transduction histidine kinase
METAPQQAPDDIQRLQGCLNHLISVQALPAEWSGLSAGEIVNTLLDTLIRLLRLNFACARVNASMAGAEIKAIRLPPGLSQDIQLNCLRTLDAWFKSDLPRKPEVMPNPIGPGEVAIARFRLGLQDQVGEVVAAAERPDFPTQFERIVFRVAANLALIGIEEARVLKRAEERLRWSETQLAEGQKLSHSGSWGWNVLSGEMVFSEETFRILGFDPAQPAPSFRTAFERIHPDDRNAIERMLGTAIRHKQNYGFEARFLMPDGTIKHVDCIGRPFTNDSGDLEFVGTLLDISERKRSEEKLETAQAQLTYMARVTTMEELVAAIAHEVNQPLAAVVTDANACLRLMAGDRPDFDEARAAAARIASEGTRAVEILGRIRALLKKGPARMEEIDVNGLILQVLDLVRPQILRHGISLRSDLAEDLPAITGDSIQLQQVVLNLIVNAIEAIAGRPDGQREVVVSSKIFPPDGVSVAVRDSGVGIDPAKLDQLFAPLYTTKPGGMGMGLSISRSIIEAHGGQLRASPNPGAGATFQFSVPRRQA